MALNINQFSQTPVQGDMDLRFNTNIISAFIDASSAGGLVPGQAVKLVPSSGAVNSVPHVVECAANTDAVYGFIVYDIKSATFGPNQPVEIAVMQSNVMYMTSSAAITQGANVSIVISGQKVVTASTGLRIVGQAFDGAAGANQLIRVTINLPGALA